MNRQSKPVPGSAESFADLRKTLAEAADLANELAGDPLLGRLIGVFRSLPLVDREPIIALLEREMAGRVLSRATEKTIGQETHLNPNARLYVRAHNSTLDPRHFDKDEMVIADIRAMRIASMIRFVPEIYETWKAAIHEAMEHVDDGVRTVAEELLLDVLAAIADARKT
jgi:hypothetical protein